MPMADSAPEIVKVIAQIQDYLAPKLDSYEQMIYHYLFRHTRLEGVREITLGVRTLQTRVGLGIGKAGSPPSQTKIAAKIRDLESKGCIRVAERSQKGTTIEVLIPSEIENMMPEPAAEPSVTLEELDFYKTPELRKSILDREFSQCFYCFRSIDLDSLNLDHVVPQANSVQDNTYKNIVATCFECNSKKQATSAEDFIRRLYREGLLNSEELASRSQALSELKAGRLVPKV